MNKVYKSILLKLSTLSPMFAKVLLDRALKRMGQTAENVTASEMLYLLKREINPQLSKKKSSMNTILNAGAGLIISNKENKIVYINSYAKKMLTEIKDKNSNGNDFDLLKKYGLCVDLPSARSLQIHEVDVDLLNRVFNVSISPILNEQKAITGVISIIQDITLINQLELESMEYTQILQNEIKYRIEAEKKLIENQQSMIHSSNLASLGEMGAGIAHEINNPLNVILLSNKLLADYLNGGEVDKNMVESCLKLSDEGVKKISNIIGSMRSLVRNEQGDPLSEVTVGEIINHVIPLCEAKFKMHELDFKVKDPNHLVDQTLHCRPGEIGQVLINLLNNSFDAIQALKEKWIRIILHMDERYITFSIIDSGHGIDPNVVKKMYEPFYSTKRLGQGTGLGMSISSKIVHNHGGELTFDSKSSHTKFDIKLPRYIQD